MKNEESTALIVRGETGLVVDRKAVDAMYTEIESSIADFEYDISSEAGRQRIASLAFSIAKKKTAVEADKKRLKEGLIAQGRAIDGAWNEIKERLEAFQQEARKPLTDWEQAQANRQKKCQDTREWLLKVAILAPGVTSAYAEKVLFEVENRALPLEDFLEFHPIVVDARVVAVASLKESIARLRKQEDDAAELIRLRKEAEDRKTAEREALRIAEENRQKAEAAEAKRVAEEKAEADRQIENARIVAEATERAAKEEQRKAREAAEAIERERQKEERLAEEKREAERLARRKEESRIADEHAKALEAERQLRIEAERKQQEESARVAREESDRKAEQKRIELEAEKARQAAAKLESNKKHRQEVMTAAKVALMEHARIDEAVAIAVVKAIVANQIPATELRFS